MDLWYSSKYRLVVWHRHVEAVYEQDRMLDRMTSVLELIDALDSEPSIVMRRLECSFPKGWLGGCF